MSKQEETSTTAFNILLCIAWLVKMILQNRWMTGNPRCHLYVLPTSFPFSSGSFFCPFSFKPNASASISCISSRHKPERKHLCTGKLLHNNQQLLKRSNYEGRNMRTKWFSVCLIFWDARSKQENILLNVFLYIFFLNFCKCNVLLNFFFNKEKQGFLCSLEKEFSKADKRHWPWIDLSLAGFVPFLL